MSKSTEQAEMSYTAEQTKMPKVVKKKGRLSSPRVILIGASIVLFCTLGFYALPGMIDEKATGSHLVNALYCAVMTLTTVGFGDICPSDKISSTGKAFIVIMSSTGLGMFCGPVMDLASSWSARVPFGGMLALASLTIAIGVIIFTFIEEMSESDAAYMSFITGTTIGYGDVTPTSDVGKIAVALYAILVINVLSGLIQQPRRLLESLCRVDEIEEHKKDD